MREDTLIQNMRDTLKETALEAARSRGQKQATSAHVLYALYRSDYLAGRLLRAHGLNSTIIRGLMGELPNVPLQGGDAPVLDVDAHRILDHAVDPVAALRLIQGNKKAAALLEAHGIYPPDRQPTREQVLAASDTGARLAQTLDPHRTRQTGVDYLAYTRLTLEAALNAET